MKPHLKHVNRIFNATVPHSHLRIHSSERLCDFPDVIWREFVESLRQSDIRYYPNLYPIYELVSEFFEISPDQLIIGSGSDRCIKYFFEAHVSAHTEVLLSDPCFPMYDVYAEIFRAKAVKFPYLGKRFSVDTVLEYINRSVRENLVVILSNPLTPIGDIIKRDELLRLLETDVPILVDEAYIEFSQEGSLLELLEDYKNLTVTRTFSKAFGSAGVRIGILASCCDSTAKYMKLRDMYEITGPTARWIQTLLRYKKELGSYVEQTVNCRNTIKVLMQSNGLEVLNSEANWLHVKEPKNISPQDFRNDIAIKYGCKLPYDVGSSWMRLSVSMGLEEDIRFVEWLQNLTVLVGSKENK